VKGSLFERLADPMRILVTPDVAERLRRDFVLRSLGETEIEGFGMQERFFLEDEARDGS
jgi:class 3 adenylate cyclase